MCPRKCNALKKQLTWELLTHSNLTIRIPSATCNPQLLVYSFSLPFTCRSVLVSLPPPDDSQLEGATLFPVLGHSPISALSSDFLEPPFKHNFPYSGQGVPMAQEKLVLIEPEYQEPGTMMIFLLPCSPNFSQHFSKASRNLLLLLFPSLAFRYEEMIWMTLHPSHLPRGPAHCRRSGSRSLCLLWHASPHQRMRSLSFSFPKSWRWADLHVALSPPRLPPAWPPLPVAGKISCNPKPSSCQLRNNIFHLPQLQLHSTKHTRKYSLLLPHSDINAHISCSMLLSRPFPHQGVCLVF